MFKINSKSNSFATDFTKIHFKNNFLNVGPTGILALVLLFPRKPIIKYNEANILFPDFMPTSGFLYEDVLLSHETMANPQTFGKREMNVWATD